MTFPMSIFWKMMDLTNQFLKVKMSDHAMSVSAVSTCTVKSLSKNDKFRKAGDVLNQICDVLSEKIDTEEFDSLSTIWKCFVEV